MFFFTVVGFLNELDPGLGLLTLAALKGGFFSIEKVFFPSLERDERSIFLVTLVEIVNVFFYSFGLP